MTTISWHTYVISQCWSLRHDKGVSNDGNGQQVFKCRSKSNLF